MNLLQENGLSIERLASFLELANSGSIKLAAGGDPSRQALISRQVGELEAFFRVKLTRRAGRGIELTDAGRELASRVRESFRSLDDFREGYAGGKRRITIAAAGSVLEGMVIPLLQTDLADQHDIRVRSARTHHLGGLVDDGQVDLAIIRSDAVGPRLERLPIGRYGYKLWVPRGLVAKHRTLLTLADLTGIAFVLPTAGQFREQLNQFFRQKEMELQVAVETDSFAQATEVLRTKRFATVLPDYAKPTLPQAEFCHLPLKGKGAPVRELCLVWRRDLADLADAVVLAVAKAARQ